MASVLERVFAKPASEFTVERGISVPPRTFGGRGRPPRYPFAQLRVGDSFAVTRAQYGKGAADANQMLSGVCNLARNYAKHHNPSAKFTTRKIDENTVRVWRIA